MQPPANPSPGEPARPADERPPGESRALAYDPASAPRHLEEVTAPMQAVSSGVKANHWLSLLIIAALMMTGAVALLILLVVGGEDNAAPFARQPITPMPCQVRALSDVNVRSGPDFAYERVWIWPAEGTRQALERFGGAWYRLADGWVPASELDINSRTACQNLPEATQPFILFDDDIQPPREVVALDWHEQLSENFATNVNTWVGPDDAEVAILREGYLALFALSPERFPVVGPALAAPLRSAYYTFRVRWVASSALAETFLIFQQTDERAYRLGLRRDGLITLTARGPDENRLLARRTWPLPSDAPFVVGVLAEEQTITVYIDDDIVLTVAENPLPAGELQLGLVGQNTTIYVDRFEITAPLVP